MKVQQHVIKPTEKSKGDVIVFFLATMIVCTLVGKGIFSLCDTDYQSVLYEVKK